MTKLWHDDERDPPDETWDVARTNAEALLILAESRVEVASLDYVLAFPENGLELAVEMVERKLLPATIICHSTSWQGANEMAETLRAGGAENVIIEAAAL